MASTRHVRGRYETGLQGRWYDADAALTGIGEQGVRAILALQPRADGSGLGVMLSPGWGTAPTGLSGEQGLMGGFSHHARPAYLAETEPALRLDGRVSWGAGISSQHVLRPWTEFSLDETSTRNLRLGVGLEGPLYMNLALERRESADQPVSHGIFLRLDTLF